MRGGGSGDRAWRHGWIVLAVAGLAFLPTISSPPSLMDDVDATYAQIARTMLESGDWVTARLNGVPYFDKPPGQVWVIAASYAAFGVHDWSTRLPMALAAIALCWLAWRTGRWAFGDEAGLYAGIGLATCYGLFLFTRVRIPDIYVACTCLLTIDCLLRAQEAAGPRCRRLMRLAGASIGVGVLFKGLVAVVLPLGALAAYAALGGTKFRRTPWGRSGLLGAAAATVAVALPWHVLSTLRNPPWFDFTLESGPGLYRGFFWRYFVNEHVLRYLGLRHPVDYDRVPLPWFWAGHLVWLFPWSFLLAGLRRFRAHPDDRAGRTRLLMLCFFGFTLAFFSLSTNQEYYTLPAYATAALLLADAAVRSPKIATLAVRGASAVHAAGLVAALTVLALAASRETPSDIVTALTSNPEQYRLSLGHFHDLTLDAFAYLRGPLALASVALAIGALGAWLPRFRLAAGSLAAASLLFVQAAHWAMQAFDPHLSTHALAQAYRDSPPGELILDHEYYAFSSVAFYANRQALLLNGRKNNIEYGSNAPGAPDVFLDDSRLADLWASRRPVYLVTFAQDRARFEKLLGEAQVHIAASSGGKVLLANRPRQPPG